MKIGHARLCLLLSFFLFSIFLSAQETPPEETTTEIVQPEEEVETSTLEAPADTDQVNVEPETPIQAETPTAPTRLFFETNPLRARVIIDGKPLLKTTPLYFPEYPRGKITVEVRKEGYLPVIREFEVKEGEINRFFVELDPAQTQVYYPREKTLVIGKEELDPRGKGYILPEGQYHFQKTNQGLKIQPRYPKEILFLGSAALIPTLLTINTFQIWDELETPYRNDNPLFTFSPETLSTTVLTVANLAFFLQLNQDRKEFYQDFYSQVREEDVLPWDESELLDRADGLLNAGQLEESRYYLGILVSDFSSSASLPFALYRMGKLYQVQGNLQIAKRIYELLLAAYPTVDTFDRTQKSLADLLLIEGKVTEALEQLDQLIYADPFVTREDIEEFRGFVRQTQEVLGE
jgi:tetratricopeptide (TPR) repeat protein